MIIFYISAGLFRSWNWGNFKNRTRQRENRREKMKEKQSNIYLIGIPERDSGEMEGKKFEKK